MRIGTFGYSHSRGLGHLVRDFHRHGVITDVLVVRHPNIPVNEDWYPGAPSVNLRSMDHGLMRDFARQMDAMLFFETPFYWDIVPFCREHGVRTFLVTMYECTPIQHPKPYRYLCPSKLDLRYFPDGIEVQLPVDYPWRMRTEARHYIHNGGYLGMRGREGTELLIEAMQYVKSPLKLTIRVQENVKQYYIDLCKADPRIEYVPETVPYEELYGVGDVAVMPQKFNGCSLPLQEALASGMCVMSTDRYPTNTWLPLSPLIPVAGTQTVKLAGRFHAIEESVIDPKDIARMMDRWYGADITALSLRGKEWAQANNWSALKPRWMEVLQS